MPRPPADDAPEPLPELEQRVRARLERVLTQIHLVELLYLRLVGLHARRLGDRGALVTHDAELERVEAELRAAQAELERLGSAHEGSDPAPRG